MTGAPCTGAPHQRRLSWACARISCLTTYVGGAIVRNPTSIKLNDAQRHVALVAVAVIPGSLIILLRVPLQGALGPTAPFLFAWIGIMFAAYVGGFWPALTVAAVGLGVGYWVLREAGGPSLGPIGALLFLGFSLTVAAAGGARQRYRRQVRAHAAHIADLQAQMMQIARLNAAGEFAGALAHELNQPLTAATNYLSAAEQFVGSEGSHTARTAELVRKASDQIARAGAVIGRARASVMRGELAPARESLADLVAEALEIATSGRAPAGLVIRCGFGPPDVVLADRVQVQQVVLNLVRNAIEAMAEQPRRELSIETRPGEPGLVHVLVSDTGPGIADDIAPRLFEPFVSSKPGGMGVGLSLCRGIIEDHGGRLWAERNPKGGATFAFSLKRADDDETQATGERHGPPTLPALGRPRAVDPPPRAAH